MESNLQMVWREPSMEIRLPIEGARPQQTTQADPSISQLNSEAMMSKMYEFEIWQDGIVVAGASGPVLEDVRRELNHYAVQYMQDGPIKITGSPELVPTPQARDLSRYR